MDQEEQAALLVDPPGEGSLANSEELRPLLEAGRERGFVRFDDLVRSLDELEVTKEQVRDLRAYLGEQGIELLSA
ncbi:MAG: RNA polymerase sigma factor region1.1 domain-containing protein, partial [Actinobacteria bacterium]|nr:RNA polymerase sigma factor region1.1 domain-containing protein [Actinomycetota bacterium]